MQEIDSFDDHYSPTKPDEYIRLRILKALRFYRERLPSYAAKRDVSQWTIMVGTATGALIAFIGFAPQVAIISSVTAAIASWMEFTTTAAKIARYNGIIVALTNLLLWWDSLSLVDKATPVNVDMLVLKAKELLALSALLGWVEVEVATTRRMVMGRRGRRETTRKRNPKCPPRRGTELVSIHTCLRTSVGGRGEC